MYDPLIVDTFLTLHTDGGFKTLAMTEESSFAVINASSAMPELSSPSRASGLEDIAASGEEMSLYIELARGLNKPMSVSEVAGVMIRHLRRIVPTGLSVLYVYDLRPMNWSQPTLQGNMSIWWPT